MAVTEKMLIEYLGLLPDGCDDIAKLCLNAAKQKAKEAGIPPYKDNAHYDLFLCALAGCFYDNRNLSFAGSTRGNASEAINVTKMINQFVLELRYAGGEIEDIKNE